MRVPADTPGLTQIGGRRVAKVERVPEGQRKMARGHRQRER